MIDNLVYELTHIEFSSYSLEDWCWILMLIVGFVLTVFYCATKQ